MQSSVAELDVHLSFWELEILKDLKCNKLDTTANTDC